jgi:methionyl-tRNA synthetase
MLLSAGLELPKAIYVHGFVTSNGQKMSKSLGNVVDPLEYIEKYGVDALRWYLMREIPTADDGDFSNERFVDVYNSELANGLGNLVNRVVMMVEKFSSGKVPAKTDGEGVLEDLKNGVLAYEKAFEDYDFKKACEVLVGVINLGNKYIDDTKPWVMAKEGNEKLNDVLYNLIEILRYIVVLVIPIMPKTAEKIANLIGVDLKTLSFKMEFGESKEGTLIKSTGAIFPRIE